MGLGTVVVGAGMAAGVRGEVRFEAKEESAPHPRPVSMAPSATLG